VRVGFSPGLRHVRGCFSVVPLWSPGAVSDGRLRSAGSPRPASLWIRGPKGDQKRSGTESTRSTSRVMLRGPRPGP
jgi:hypothetical protein